MSGNVRHIQETDFWPTLLNTSIPLESVLVLRVFFGMGMSPWFIPGAVRLIILGYSFAVPRPSPLSPLTQMQSSSRGDFGAMGGIVLCRLFRKTFEYPTSNRSLKKTPLSIRQPSSTSKDFSLPSSKFEASFSPRVLRL